MKQVLLDTDDLCVAEDVVSAFFGRIRMSVRERGAPTRARMVRSFVGSTSVDVADFGYSFDFTMTPPDKILLARVHSGSMVLKAAPPELFGPGTVGAFGALHGDPFSGTCHRGHWDTFMVDNALLGQVATTRDDAPIRLTGSSPVSDAANQQLRAAMDYVRGAVAANADMAANPLIAGTAQRHLAACILAAYPNTAQTESSSVDRHDSAEPLLRKAISFIEDNAHRDISLRDIAEAVHVTPRAVQYMFRKHRDRTPMQYLRELRLHYAHLDLVAGNPSTISVRTAATRWGFAHMGRFAANYRQIYGQPPQTTLHS